MNGKEKEASRGFESSEVWGLFLQTCSFDGKRVESWCLLGVSGVDSVMNARCPGSEMSSGPVFLPADHALLWWGASLCPCHVSHM